MLETDTGGGFVKSDSSSKGSPCMSSRRLVDRSCLSYNGFDDNLSGAQLSKEAGTDTLDPAMSKSDRLFNELGAMHCWDRTEGE